VAFLQPRNLLSSILGGGSPSKGSLDIFKQFSTPGDVLSGVLLGDKKGLEALSAFSQAPAAAASPNMPDIDVRSEEAEQIQRNAILERGNVQTRANRSRKTLARASAKPQINLARSLLGE